MFFLPGPSTRSHAVITFRETVKLYTYESPENGTPTQSVLESFGALEKKKKKKENGKACGTAARIQ